MNTMNLPNPLKNIRQDIQSMHAYAIQDSTGMVKLDAMENPFPLPPELQKALGERLGAVAINRYPGARIEDLRHALSRYVDLPEGFALMLGNGSDELISLLSMVWISQPTSSWTKLPCWPRCARTDRPSPILPTRTIPPPTCGTRR